MPTKVSIYKTSCENFTNILRSFLQDNIVTFLQDGCSDIVTLLQDRGSECSVLTKQTEPSGFDN